MIKQLLKFSNISQKFKDTFVEFPVVVLFIFTSLIFALFYNHDIEVFQAEFQKDFLWSMILSIVPLTSLRLFVKSTNRNFIFELIATLFIVLFTAYNVLYFSTSSFFLIILNIVSLTFAPFLFKRSSNKAFLLFNFDTFYAVVFSFISSIILLLGLNAIFASVAYLFEFKLPSYVHEDIAVVSMLGVFTLLVLAHISRDFEYKNYGLRLTKPFLILIKNILVPLLYIYMVILYAYFFKILIEQSLPKGSLAAMIISFGSIGIFVKILIYIIKDKESRFINLYDKYYYHIMLVPILMLIVSLYRRVSDYGITESRYAIGLFVLWFIFVSIFSIIKKENFNLKYIVISMFTLCFVALLGPLSATNISAKSQFDRFYDILEKNKLLVDGIIVPSKVEHDIDTRIQISSLASYLSKNEASRGEIEKLFPSIKGLKHSSSTKILETLNINFANKYMKNKEFEKDRVKIDLRNIFINTKGYDYVLRAYISKQNKRVFDFSNEELQIELKNKILTLSFENSEDIAFDLEEYTQALKKRKIITITKKNKEDAIIKAQSKDYIVELQILNLDRYLGKIGYIEAYVLIKKVKND